MISSPFFSLSLQAVAQIRGHIAGSSPPSRLRFVPFMFVARRLEPFTISSLVDWRRIAPIQAINGRSQQLTTQWLIWEVKTTINKTKKSKARHASDRWSILTWWSGSARQGRHIPYLHDLAHVAKREPQSAWSRTRFLGWICTIVHRSFTTSHNSRLESRLLSVSSEMKGLLCLLIIAYLVCRAFSIAYLVYISIWHFSMVILKPVPGTYDLYVHLNTYTFYLYRVDNRHPKSPFTSFVWRLVYHTKISIQQI